MSNDIFYQTHIWWTALRNSKNIILIEHADFEKRRMIALMSPVLSIAGAPYPKVYARKNMWKCNIHVYQIIMTHVQAND